MTNTIQPSQPLILLAFVSFWSRFVERTSETQVSIANTAPRTLLTTMFCILMTVICVQLSFFTSMEKKSAPLAPNRSVIGYIMNTCDFILFRFRQLILWILTSDSSIILGYEKECLKLCLCEEMSKLRHARAEISSLITNLEHSQRTHDTEQTAAYKKIKILDSLCDKKSDDIMLLKFEKDELKRLNQNLFQQTDPERESHWMKMVEELRVKKEASDYFHSKLCFDSLSATNHHQSETIAILQAKLKKVQTDLVGKDGEIQQIQFHQNCLTTESASSKIIIAFLEDKVAFFRKEVPKHQGRLHATKKNINHTPRTAWTLSLNNKLTDQITQIRRDWAKTSTTFQRKIGKITGKLKHITQLKSQLETRLKTTDKEVAMLKIMLAAVPEEIMAL